MIFIVHNQFFLRPCSFLHPWLHEYSKKVCVLCTSGDYRGSAGLHLDLEVSSPSSGTELRPADQAALRPAEGLRQSWSRPWRELPPGSELL